MKVTKHSAERFAYFSLCQDSQRLPAIAMDPNGYSAMECFHAHETYGTELPCREPELLGRALNGKQRHGITVSAAAEDYVDRILFAAEINASYPRWVAREIFRQAAKIAEKKLGWVPSFVASRSDFTTA